ncbi:MAG TPA: beta-propeller domain-containing protein [Candidatus Mediterraneibacter stercorigallinarum]|uniref:Beta-propeller domain-containing protein n=1 Tax=Candidatus Mediterraneibacter stercorigallinarum TaxID=2838686 RepID=A0A9D2IK46_9FIRM|nr:beta-propeller domain-containing protein [Candidatus Mediterraneibacter stercorigallinarum]
MEKNENRTMDEQREAAMEEKLRDLTGDTEIPPSLEPEAVERLLLEKKKEKAKKYRRRYAGIAAAACLCIAVGAGAVVAQHVNMGGGSPTAGMSGSAQADADSEEAGSSESETVNLSDKIASAKDYDQIYEYIQAEQKQQEKQARMYTDGMTTDNMMEMAEADSASANGAAGGSAMDAGSSGGSAAYSGSDGGGTGNGYSDTNVREDGVGEADIVKTDGENLYILNGTKVEIVSIASDEMQELAAVAVDADSNIRELYVDGDRLAVLYTRSDYTKEDGFEVQLRDYTCTDVYDISDKSAPVKLNTISQSGYYNTMRVKDGYAYVLSSFYADTAAPRSDVGAYVPEVEGSTIEADRIYMPESEQGSQYTVITAFSLAEPQEQTDSRAVFGSAGLCYVSGSSIYVTETCYDEAGSDVTQTAVRKVSYHDGQLEGAAQAKVDGTLNDSFSIDEYNGYLRLVTTVTPIGDGVALYGSSAAGAEEETVATNSLYVLNEALELTGEITDLAVDEQVYSARFMGDIGYFVTFRQVDPLFSVDLSDPAEPKIIGELKIPGFSDYLHPYGEGQLLGIGMDVDEEGVTTEGVKLSMFDISDPANVTEASQLVLENMYGTDVAYNYKSVFVDVEKNLFGFRAYGPQSDVYYIFSYDAAEGFKEVFSRELTGYGESRGLYAGAKFYLIVGNTIESYTLAGFEKIDDIVLGNVEPVAIE